MNNYDSNIEFEKSSFNLFNFDKFRKFIIKNNIVPLSMSIPIGYLLKDFVVFIINNLIYPILDSYLNLSSLNKKKILKINNKDINLGKLLYKLIHLLITLYLLFIISRFLQDFIN